MSPAKQQCHSVRFGKHLVAVISLTSACSFSDYSYLGAKRDSDPSTQTGGARTVPSGGAAGQGGQSGSGTDAGSSSPVSGGQGGESASVIGGMTAFGGSTTTYNPAGGVPTDAGATNTVHSSTTAGGGSTSGGVAGATNGGTTGTSGGSPSGGTGGSATTAPPPSSCSGCAVLEVPFTGLNQTVRYYMLFTPAVAVNTRSAGAGGSGGTVTAAGTLKMRVFAPLLGNRQYQLIIQRSLQDYEMCFSGYRSLPTAVTAEWTILEWNLQSCTTDTDIGRLGLDLRTSDATTDPTPSLTRMWVDSIWIERGESSLVGPFGFDASSSVNATPVLDDWTQDPGVLYYRPSIPPDAITPPTGTTISWRSN
jgi:hypothetical protein